MHLTYGTTQAGADYTATSGTLTFEQGETSKIVSVPVLDDSDRRGGGDPDVVDARLSYGLRLRLPRPLLDGTVRDLRVRVRGLEDAGGSEAGRDRYRYRGAGAGGVLRRALQLTVADTQPS